MKNKFLILLAAAIIILAFGLIMMMPDDNEEAKEAENGVTPTQEAEPETITPVASNTAEPTKPGDSISRFDFEKTGNLVGEELVYEEPGKPALRVKLKVGEDSWCDGRKCGSSLTGKYEEGQRVAVKGVLVGDSEVAVKYLTVVK